MVTVYAYSGCDTCRRALRWLAARGIVHRVIPVREQPPSRKELDRLLGAVGGEIRRLFNTSGRDYREMGIGARLGDLSVDEALALLEGNGNLLKRPAVLGPSVATVGFREEEWERLFGAGPEASAR